MIQYSLAELNDINAVLELQGRYQLDNISEEDKTDGFVTTPFTADQLQRLILQEKGLFVAKDESTVIAYAMSASWHYWSEWPMFQFMINELPQHTFKTETLSVTNSCQYGPICIHKKFRGTGVLEGIFDFARDAMSKRYPIMITFINKENPRSYEAHTRKLHMTTLHEFQFNCNAYYELAYDTSQKLPSYQN
ncbi:GNAT family acetyltransferase [Desulfosediminicola sp.]|uniref:GNAT family acetyltransferase n=1 Tax=Desulfosediminicola sp. TaxID=2886825 RepID=UPI003AF24A8A